MRRDEEAAEEDAEGRSRRRRSTEEEREFEEEEEEGLDLRKSCPATGHGSLSIANVRSKYGSTTPQVWPPKHCIDTPRFFFCSVEVTGVGHTRRRGKIIPPKNANAKFSRAWYFFATKENRA
jgi:hypothetical protein